MLTMEEKANRKTGLGGSDIAGVLNIAGAYKSATEIYFEKISDEEIIEEETIDFKSRLDMGNLIEDFIRNSFFMATGKTGHKPSGTFRHAEYPWALCHLDGLIDGENAILECKNSTDASEWGEEWTDQIPMKYLVQAAHNVAVLNADKAYIAVLLWGNCLKIYEYIRNHELEKAMLAKCKFFWEENVLKRIPPEPKDINDFYKTFPFAEQGKTAFADDNILLQLQEYKRIQKDIKNLEKQSDEKKKNILSIMKDSEILVDNHGKALATFKSQVRLALNQGKFKEENKEIFEKYLEQKSCRVFNLVKEKKNAN